MAQGVIVKAVSGFYYVDDGERVIQCRARGIFKKEGITPLVGDQVKFSRVGSEGVVEEILPRTSALVRPPIANVALVCIFISLKEPDLNERLLDRMLVQAESQHVQPLICVTKVDLDADKQMLHHLQSIYEPVGYDVLVVSGKFLLGLNEFQAYIAGKTCVLTGPSGVGKSTFLHALLPEAGIKMGDVSQKIGRGKHTTRHVELFRLNPHTFVADTPGFSQLDVTNMEPEQLQFWFPEIRTLRESCEYRRCLHESEEGCAIRSALDHGNLSDIRYGNYLAFLKEVREAKNRRYS
ncbi:ribosome small subunit-dependent GTPase A [Fodinisporobacter ferrooxydans]|uniref:Small ribosomal subunit biogenesis GTPase RsgA n=1 Tax=Fodinisporobacter ferrooxydans TaxID=2901836 RepID=A0ABY4CMX2_9BACL|nr:ribosome small subunit-dependent GTPase A [Alicyclobacillaceae bacterium MYW30-H2]